MVLNLKILKFKKNLVTTVQDEQLNEMILNFVGTTIIHETGADKFLSEIGSKLTEWWPFYKKSIFKFKI